MPPVNYSTTKTIDSPDDENQHQNHHQHLQQQQSQQTVVGQHNQQFIEEGLEAGAESAADSDLNLKLESEFESEPELEPESNLPPTRLTDSYNSVEREQEKQTRLTTESTRTSSSIPASSHSSASLSFSSSSAPSRSTALVSITRILFCMSSTPRNMGRVKLLTHWAPPGMRIRVIHDVEYDGEFEPRYGSDLAEYHRTFDEPYNYARSHPDDIMTQLEFMRIAGVREFGLPRDIYLSHQGSSLFGPDWSTWYDTDHRAPIGNGARAGYSVVDCVNSERKAAAAAAALKQPYADVDWYVIMDDDTLILPEALQALLAQYDPLLNWYIGSVGETAYLTTKHNFEAFGGGGFVFSAPVANSLASLLPTSLSTFSGLLFGSDEHIAVACAELGVPLTQLTSFHQFDVHHSAVGMIESNRQLLVGLHNRIEKSILYRGDVIRLRKDQRDGWPRFLTERNNAILRELYRSSSQFGAKFAMQKVHLFKSLLIPLSSTQAIAKSKRWNITVSKPAVDIQIQRAIRYNTNRGDSSTKNNRTTTQPNSPRSVRRALLSEPKPGGLNSSINNTNPSNNTIAIAASTSTSTSSPVVPNCDAKFIPAPLHGRGQFRDRSIPSPRNRYASDPTWSIAISRGYSLKLFPSWTPAAFLARTELTFSIHSDLEAKECVHEDHSFPVRKLDRICHHYLLFDYDPIERVYRRHRHPQCDEMEAQIYTNHTQRFNTIEMVCDGDQPITHIIPPHSRAQDSTQSQSQLQSNTKLAARTDQPQQNSNEEDEENHLDNLSKLKINADHHHDHDYDPLAEAELARVAARNRDRLRYLREIGLDESVRAEFDRVCDANGDPDVAFAGGTRVSGSDNDILLCSPVHKQTSKWCRMRFVECSNLDRPDLDTEFSSHSTISSTTSDSASASASASVNTKSMGKLESEVVGDCSPLLKDASLWSFQSVDLNWGNALYFDAHGAGTRIPCGVHNWDHIWDIENERGREDKSKQEKKKKKSNE